MHARTNRHAEQADGVAPVPGSPRLLPIRVVTVGHSRARAESSAFARSNATDDGAAFFFFSSFPRVTARARAEEGKEQEKRSKCRFGEQASAAASASALGVITATGALPPLNAAALGIMRGRPKKLPLPFPSLPHVLPSSQPPQLNVCPPATVRWKRLGKKKKRKQQRRL